MPNAYSYSISNGRSSTTGGANTLQGALEKLARDRAYYQGNWERGETAAPWNQEAIKVACEKCAGAGQVRLKNRKHPAYQECKACGGVAWFPVPAVLEATP